jgi:hypothetical protein
MKHEKDFETIAEADANACDVMKFYAGHLAHAAGLPQPADPIAADGWQNRADALRELAVSV